MKSPLVVDIETCTAPFDDTPLTLAWQLLGEAHAHVADFEGVPDGVFEMMADGERPFVSHTKYDARFLRLSGISVNGPFYDTQVMAWMLNENQSLALDPLARRYLHLQMDKRIKVRSGTVFFVCDDGQIVRLEDAPREQVWAYNARDVEATVALFETLWEMLDDGGYLERFLQEEVPFTGVLLDMECRGLPVDLERTARFTAELEEAHVRLAAELYDDSGLPPGFNINSNDHMASYLFSKVFELTDTLDLAEWQCGALKSCLADEHEDCRVPLECDGDCPDGQYCVPHGDLAFEEQHVCDLLPIGFSADSVGRTQVHGRYTLKGRGLRPSVKTDSGKWSVSRPTLKVNLSSASDPWVQKLLEYRSIDKLLTTYLRKWPLVAQRGRIYGRFNQTGTKTGRLSSSEPNMQNIPSHGSLGPRVRDLFRVAS